MHLEGDIRESCIREKTALACRGVSEEQQQQLEAGPAVYEAEICSLREELSALATAFDNETASSHALKEVGVDGKSYRVLWYAPVRS